MWLLVVCVYLCVHLDLLLADGVVAAGVVVGRVLLAGDELLGVEEGAVGSRPHLVTNISC